MADEHAIPIIDIGPYIDPDSTPGDKAKVVALVKDACAHYGFLQIKGHGVPVQAQRQMLASCKTLFDLPIEQKDKVSFKHSAAKRGYERMREQTLDKTALPDDKEGFNIGREEPHGKGLLRGSNQWPDLPSEAFRTPVVAYYDHMLTLSRQIVEMMALGLGYPVSVLESYCATPAMNLKLLHYPKHTSTDTRQFGAGQHTDFGAITILLQQPGKHGLQVYYAPNDQWLDVPAVEDVFVVNMADMIQSWTNEAYRSVLHRVINAADGDRYSIPAFYEGNWDSRNPFDPGAKDGETVEEHVLKRLTSSYDVQ